MLVAAPESSCGAVVGGGAGMVLETGVDLRFVTVSTAADRSVRPTLVSVVLAKSSRVALGMTGSETRSHIPRSCGRYSVDGVSSRELAKWEPMPVAFSVAEAIH